jgi:hypothetical protein
MVIPELPRSGSVPDDETDRQQKPATRRWATMTPLALPLAVVAAGADGIDGSGVERGVR